VRVGKFKPPIGLERLQRNPRLLLLERSLVDNLIPNRDVGVAWQASGRLEAALGVFNQAADRRRDNEDVDNRKVFVARLFGQPFVSGPLAGLSLGVAGNYGTARDAPTLSTGQTSGRSTVFRYAADALRDGTEARISPQFHWFEGPFGVFGEQVVSKLELTNDRIRRKITNRAWQITGSWVLTGEDNGWRGITPARPYVLGGSGWGAWELVARVGELDYDDDLFPAFADPQTSISRARAYEAGLNWYPNALLRVMFNLAHTEFEGGAAGGANREDEDVVMARFQVTF
jgi:phosphate-selective porin OprO/OprP